ncbi:unnamed protein product [Amoebophrya sp. A25]|nr:unnamed protein product [Amoebophrya sp. A25]|eukprot:GSA25T00021904001.1
MLASSSLARDSACAACALRSSLVGGLNALVCNGCRSSPICATSSRTCTPSSTGPPAGVFGTSCTSRSSRRTIAPGTAPCVLRTDVKHFSSRGVFEGDDGTMGDLSARSNSCSSSSTGGGTGGGFFPPISLLTSSQASVSGASAGGVFTNKNLLDRAQHDFQRRGLIQAFSSLSSCPATSSSSTGASSTGQPPGVEHVILGQGPIPDITSSIGSPSKLTTLSCGGGREPPENGPGRPPEKGKPSSSSSSTGTSTSSPSHPTAASKNTTTSASTIPRSASSSSTSASSADSSSSRSASSNGGMSSNGKNGTNGVSTTFSNGTSNGNGNGKGHRFKASHQAEKSTSLQSKRKLRREQLKNYLNPERVLFTAQGLVLKAKAAGRFTVSKLQNLRKGIVRVCKDPRVLSLWAQDVKDAVKHFIEWNKQGFGLFWLNMKVTRKLLTRRMQGHTLSYRDRQLLVRTTGDVFKLIPFSFFLIIPFAEIALPPVLYFFPGLMPSTFLEKGQENESLVRKLKAKKELAVFFQEVVDANTKEQIFKAASADSEKGMSLEEAQYEFNAFQAKMERGEFPSAQEVVRFSKQFGRWFTFDNLPDDKLRIMADILGLGDSPLFRSHLALRLRHHINRLRREDREIMFEGVDSLSRDDLVELCRARAIPFTADISDEAMREGLRGWLELSAHRQIPVSVLLWVQTYYLTGEGKLEGLDLDKVVETPASLNGTAGSRQSSRGKTAPLGKTVPLGKRKTVPLALLARALSRRCYKISHALPIVSVTMLPPGGGGGVVNSKSNRHDSAPSRYALNGAYHHSSKSTRTTQSPIPSRNTAVLNDTSISSYGSTSSMDHTSTDAPVIILTLKRRKSRRICKIQSATGASLA